MPASAATPALLSLVFLEATPISYALEAFNPTLQLVLEELASFSIRVLIKYIDYKLGFLAFKVLSVIGSLFPICRVISSTRFFILSGTCGVALPK